MLAVAATAALVCFAWGLWQTRRSRGPAAWQALPLLLAAATMALRGQPAWLHDLLALATLAAALRNAMRNTGPVRLASGAGAAAWLAALMAAYLLF